MLYCSRILERRLAWINLHILHTKVEKETDNKLYDLLTLVLNPSCTILEALGE